MSELVTKDLTGIKELFPYEKGLSEVNELVKMRLKYITIRIDNFLYIIHSDRLFKGFDPTPIQSINFIKSEQLVVSQSGLNRILTLSPQSTTQN